MRLVCVADTHLCHRDLVWPEGDVLIHAGDLLQMGGLDELEEAAAFLMALPYRHKVLVAGNHDVCFEEQPQAARALLGEGIEYLQDRGVVLGGIRFWGSPWQPEFGNWSFNLPRGAALAEKWALIPAETDVLITHGPPLGFGDRTRWGGLAGCEELLARVTELGPRLHLFGHIHEDGGVFRQGTRTLVNCTTWESERAPTVIDVTAGLDGGLEVTVVSAAGEQRRRRRKLR